MKLNFEEKTHTHLCTCSFHQIGQEKYIVKSNDEDEIKLFY